MNLPPFSEFQKAFDAEKLDYDLEHLASSGLKKSSSLFTREQYDFLCQTMAAMQLSILQQYHQWLSEQLSRSL